MTGFNKMISDAQKVIFCISMKINVFLKRIPWINKGLSFETAPLFRIGLYHHLGRMNRFSCSDRSRPRVPPGFMILLGSK